MKLETLFFNGLNVTGAILEMAILIRMFKNNLRVELRLFFAFIAFSLVQNALAFSVRNYFGFYSVEYFLTYWFLFVMETALAFFIIHEIYAKALYRYEGLRHLSAMMFRWAFMLLTVVAVMIALSSPAADRDAIYSGILLIDRSAVFIEFGLVILLFIFARSLSLSWRECVFGIAVGMCFYCSMEIVAISLRTHYKNAIADIYTVVKPIVWIMTLAIWTSYVYRTERARDDTRGFVSHDLNEWNAAVLKFLNR